MFYQTANWASEVGFKLDFANNGGYLLIDEATGAEMRLATIALVSDVLAVREAELMAYAEEWNENTHRIRPV